MPERPTEVSTGLLREWPLPSVGSDKNSRGRLLIVGGSRQTPGALLLAATAAMRAGAGKVQVLTVASTATHLAVALPETLVVPAPEDESGEIDVDGLDAVLEQTSSVDVVLLGPGIMTPDTGARLRSRVLDALDCAVVLDALGLSALADEGPDLGARSAPTVLTPNAGEVELAAAKDAELPDDEAEAAAYLAAAVGATVTSGGRVTWTVDPQGRRWRDPSGPPGLASAGSGDVKSGIVAALLARGATPEQSAVWGSHLHALAGENLARTAGPVGFLARELPTQLPAILQSLGPGSAEQA
jgi:ADP-dependent NAD(P)H-hydrate dehydratase